MRRRYRPHFLLAKRPGGLAASFWDKVKTDPYGCWEWQAYVDQNGYGQFMVMGKRWFAHRFSWTISTGQIPAGMLICHSCDNKKCVRPDHLFLGDHSINALDALSKVLFKPGNRNLNKPRCIRGHGFTKDNTYRFKNGEGKDRRQCRACNKMREERRVRSWSRT